MHAYAASEDTLVDWLAVCLNKNEWDLFVKVNNIHVIGYIYICQNSI